MKKIKNIVCFTLCIIIIASTSVWIFIRQNNENKGQNSNSDLLVLDIWQIDSFEGGKGSRASYLQKVADNFSKTSGIYSKVTLLEYDSALLNLKNGKVPDLISFGAGLCGFENYISESYYCWCYGGYCLLSLNTDCDFSDVTNENTVINIGKNNLSGVAAAFCGLNKSDALSPTAAYTSLIAGKYKYLLGTQRDIFRLKSRSLAFSVKAVTEFNDLYQLISITTNDKKKRNAGERFIKYLMEKDEEVKSIGMMSCNKSVHSDEMHVLENVEYEIKLNFPVNESLYKSLKQAQEEKDCNMIKNLIK